MLSGAIHLSGRKVCGRAGGPECEEGRSPALHLGREETWQFPPQLLPLSLRASLLARGSHAHPGLARGSGG